MRDSETEKNAMKEASPEVTALEIQETHIVETLETLFASAI